jgi:SAM-dependent methyltransferase
LPEERSGPTVLPSDEAASDPVNPMDDETFARLYTAQYASYEEDLPLWRALAEDYGSPVLEIGCGAGRVLLPLAEAGHTVTGVDINPAMLRRARAAAAGPHMGRVLFVHGDLRALDLEQRFRLVFSPCNTLAALDDAGLAAAFAGVRAHLHPAGAFAFEVPGPGEELVDHAPEEPLAAFIDGESGNPIQLSATQDSDVSAGRVVVTWRYDELLPDGTVQSWTLPVPFYLRPPEDYARLLERARLRPVAFYGDFQRRTLAPGDARRIVVAVTEERLRKSLRDFRSRV